MSKEAPVWLLPDNRLGDNNQLKALARALGLHFETKRLAYNRLKRLPFFHHQGLAILTARSRALIEPPWPELVLATGYPTVPVARYIRGQSEGRTKLVHIGNPRQKIDDFDLQITTPQYRRRAKSLLELPMPIGNPVQDARATSEELCWLGRFPHPRRLIAVGGPARHWRLDHRALEAAIGLLRAKNPVGSLIVAVSARTTTNTARLLARLVHAPTETLVDQFPRFAVLLRECDEIYVTADSVSMLSEAVLTGKPVGMISICRSTRGWVGHVFSERLAGRPPLPNFPDFWKQLRQDGLIGTVELPVVSQVCDTVDRAARAVRELLSGDIVDEQET